ncbi:serine/threonine protein phosphatase [Ochrobactrum sp. CM-21-5]|nr:serine/threonine protein phosphatase [Ochrobactrum sp. CM-21-5]MBC2884008.1 serine/threonine protein phosphatase [Ochrobactrum sp. CM-21-5]
MKDETGNLTMELDADDLRSLLALLAQSRGRRISSAVIGGRQVWIKRFDAEKRPWPKRLHGRISPFLVHSFLRSPQNLDETAMAGREQRKMKAFLEAGFQVPRVVYHQGPVMVLSDVAPMIQNRLDSLRKTDPEEHDRLLVHCARSLGEVHAAGLCHGRPHPRDFFERGGTAGFLDFEEEPEAVMPLAVAQARDVWLLFFQITSQAKLRETAQNAFAIYRALAPAHVISELRKIVGFFRFTIAPLRLFRRIYLGGDGERLLQAMEFFDSFLMSGSDPVIENDKT